MVKPFLLAGAAAHLVTGAWPVISAAGPTSHVAWFCLGSSLLPAFLYNALGIPVAAGVLYPLFGVLLSPVIAGAAMSLSSVSVISNALRLRNVRL